MTIEIEDLTFYTIIGLLEHERVNEQRVIINLSANYNYKDGNFIDYVKICELIKNHIKESKFKLLEDALLSTANILINNFSSINSLKIKITKPDILTDAKVSLYYEKEGN